MAMTWRNRATAIAVAATLVGGCAPSTHPGSRSAGPASPATAAAAARGVEAARSTIPWAQVGPGWLLATWSPAPGRGSGDPPPGQPTAASVPTTLFLVNPAGGRYPIVSFPPADEGPGVTLDDWSGDGGHALLHSVTPGGSGNLTITSVDLHTGRQSAFTLANGGVAVVPHFSRPQGKAIVLAKEHDTEPAALRRVDLTGRPELSYPVGPDFQGSFLSTPDGTELVLGMGDGLALMGNDGTAGTTLSIPGGRDCVPTRWWNTTSTVVLARCLDNYLSRLWLVPIGGGPPTALTAPLTGKDQDLGDRNAWQLPSGTYVQDDGACGSAYLAKLSGVGGTTAPVTVPEVAPRSSVHVIGASDGKLHLQATASCGTGTSLLDYDPAANTSTVLLGPPLNGGGVIAAVPYPGQR